MIKARVGTFILGVFVLLISFSGCATEPVPPKFLADTDAYTKDPKNDVLVEILAVGSDGTPYLNESVTFNMTKSFLGNTDTSRQETPYALRIPFDNFIAQAKPAYTKLSSADKLRAQVLLAQQLLITIVAQSQNESYGVIGIIYFAGKQQVVDKAAIPYGMINLSYSIPVEDLLNKE